MTITTREALQGLAVTYSLKILASLGGVVSMVLRTWPRARSAADWTLAGASPFSIMDCTQYFFPSGISLAYRGSLLKQTLFCSARLQQDV